MEASPGAGVPALAATACGLRTAGTGPVRARTAGGAAGFVALGAAVFAPALLLAWLYRTFGFVGLLPGVVGLAATGAAGRRVVRRRGGHYTPAELARLDDPGLVVAAARMLRRDG